jgi:hypothetical protein
MVGVGLAGIVTYSIKIGREIYKIKARRIMKLVFGGPAAGA